MRSAVLLLLIAGVACPLVVGYHVDPVRANWSGWTGHQAPNNRVSQVLTINFDELDSASGAYCELFAGTRGAGGQYHVTVLSYPGGFRIGSGVADGNVDHQWTKFKIGVEVPDSIVKGKQLELRFTRGGSDSIQFYWAEGDKYPWGWLMRAEVPYAGQDLAMRVMARMDAIDSLDFGADEASWYVLDYSGHPCPWPDVDSLADLAKTARVKTVRLDLDWRLLQPDSAGQWDTVLLDSSVRTFANSAGCRILALTGCPPGWASTRLDTNGWGQPEWRSSPPRGLEHGVNSDSNCVARFLRRLIVYCDRKQYPIHDWEVLNEVNSEGTSPSSGSMWQHPNRYYAGDSVVVTDTVGPGIHPMCSLYVRMAVVMDSVLRLDPDHSDDRIAVNSVNFVNTPDPNAPRYAGKAWLREFYDVVRECNLPHFWDAISVHPYEETLPPYPPTIWPFGPSEFEAHAETLRSIMREHGDYGELWNTEFSMPGLFWWTDTSDPHYMDIVTTPQQDADYCCEAFTTAEGMKGLPGGAFDRNYWWFLRQPPLWGSGCWGLMDSALNIHPSFYAFKQTAEQLAGKRFNGRVMTGDAATDAHVRMYEFETNDTLHRRTWVCWRNWGSPGDGQPPPTSPVPLPVRNDTLQLDSLAYTDIGQPMQVTADADGWLRIGMATRPAFVTETKAASRPELVVDSFLVMPQQPQVGKEMGFAAFVTNRGRATPDSVWYKLLCDDAPVCSVPGASIGSGASDSLTVIGCVVPSWMRGQHLFRLEINPGQKFVEKDGMDDNDGYSRNTVVWSPVGDLIGVFDGSHSNEPLALLRLESHAMEVDTTGQTPCDSARLVQWWYGLNDTVVHGGDTTAWFCVNQETTFDTTCRYLSGQGKYKLFVQLKDSWSVSDLIPDTTHPFVVFDTTPPAGSVVINAGARFAPSATCTLRLAACDSASGVCEMRFMNRPRVNLVKNGTFAQTDGSWSFSGGGYDSLLHMGLLSVSPSAESKARQFVPAESISAHYGDSCVLEANIMALMHDGDATGDVSFWYYSTRQDTSLHDTLWSLVDSACYSGDLLSLTGRYNLATRFLLVPPAADSGWVWRGGMVKVRAQGVESGTGNVWSDNVALNLFQPQSGYTWWGAYDTLAAWSMGGAAGQHVIRALYIDSAGTENEVAFADTVILDTTPPFVHISLPQPGQYVSHTVEITGWAYDSIVATRDTWFASRRLFYRHQDSTNWLPVTPDSVSYSPAYKNENALFGPAVHLGYWNTGSLPIGNYYVKASDDDSAGHSSNHVTWVVVSNGGMGGNSCGGPEGGGTGLGEGSIYVGSASGQVLHLSDDMDSLDCFTVSDSGSQAYVTAILETKDDSLIILDARNKRIHKLHRNGQKGRRLVSGLSLPIDVTKDDNDNFWLVDKALDRIGKFRWDGTLVFTRGGPGRDSTNLDSPEAITVKGSLVYVADEKNDRIAVWDTSGDYQGSIRGDFANPTAVMVTDSGTVYLTDGSDGKVKGITPLGGSIVAITASGGSKLRGLVLSENGHSVFTLAAQPNTVYKLRIQSDDSTPGGVQSGGKLNLPKLLSLAQPFPNPARTRLNISYALPRQTRVSVKLYDIAGKLVTTLASGDQKPGYYNLTWNRQDAKGRSCACGVYFCTLSAENKRFSRKVVLTE